MELGHFLDTTHLGVVVLHFEALALQGVLLHTLVIESANRVHVGASSQLLELLRGLVQLKDLLHTVVVLTHIVLVLKNAESAVDLILKAELHVSFCVFTINIINY